MNSQPDERPKANFVRTELTVARRIAGEISGEYDHVAWIDVLPFNIAPEVIIWGQRVFVPVSTDPAENPRYREAFAYAAVGECA